MDCDYQYLYEEDHRNDNEPSLSGDCPDDDPVADSNTIVPTPEPNACTVKLHDDLPFQPELLVVASFNDIPRSDALIDSGCQVTAISTEFARLLQLPMKPSNITMGVADSRRVKVAGTARVTIRVLNARPVEMSVLVFDGLLYSALIGLDYLAASSAMIQPGQTPSRP